MMMIFNDAGCVGCRRQLSGMQVLVVVRSSLHFTQVRTIHAVSLVLTIE